MGAGSFRQSAASIDLDNVIVMVPQFHHNPRLLPSKWLIPVLVQYLAYDVGAWVASRLRGAAAGGAWSRRCGFERRARWFGVRLAGSVGAGDAHSSRLLLGLRGASMGVAALAELPLFASGSSAAATVSRFEDDAAHACLDGRVDLWLVGGGAWSSFLAWRRCGGVVAPGRRGGRGV